MPRRDELTKRAEVDELRKRFAAPALTLVTTTIIPHERNDRPGRQCPCCGDTEAWGLGRIDDLAVLINADSQSRKNRWKLETDDGRAAFDRTAAKAQPWGTPDAMVWHADIVYRCTEAQVDVLTDDVTETTLITGGWRSGKTFLGDSKWTRCWVKRGGRGEIFWLLAPALMRTWKNMRKIFYGKESDPAILPTYQGEPILARGLPDKHTSSHMHFEWLDGSRGELYHAGHGGGGHLEGDDVAAIHFDEPSRVRDSDAFDVCRSRVAQSRGQFILSTVPDDEGAWIYDKIVQPIEQGTAKHSRMVSISSYENVFVPRENIQRLEEGESDPKVIAEKIHGKWTNKGAFAYGDCFDDSRVVDTNSHQPDAWGFAHDVTRLVTKGVWGPDGVPYVCAADSNWDPQTVAIAKVFGDEEHPSTWTLCWIAEQLLTGDTEMSAQALAKKDGGRYRGHAGIVCDANMFHEANYHGGHANRSYDAAEYKRVGFKVCAPIRTQGTKYSDPDVLEARKLVRKMLREDKMFFSEVGCPQMIRAMSKVPNRAKRRDEAGTRIDREIYNIDDVVRYLSWKFFSKRLLPARPPAQIVTAPRDPHRAAH